MKRGLIIAVVVVVAFFAAFYAAARKMQSLSDSSYADTTGPLYSRTPEWDELWQYESEGPAGWAGLEQLIASADPGVAAYAADLLAQQAGSYEHLFRGMPTIQPSSKPSLAMASYSNGVWDYALDVIKNQDAELLEGAAFFLRIAYANNTHMTQSWKAHEFSNALVASIPIAEGAYAEHLPETIKLYPPWGEFTTYVPPDSDEEPEEVTVDGLLELVDSDDPAVRVIVVRTMGKLGREYYLEFLRELANDPDPIVRQAVVTAKSSIALANSPAKVTQSPGSSVEKPKKRLGMP